MSSETASDSTASARPAAEAEIDALNELAWTLRRSDATEGLRLAERAGAAARAAGYARGEAYALRNAGACHCMLEDYDAALPELQDAARRFDALQDARGKASTLNWIGNLRWRRADFPAALRAHLEALRFQREEGDRDGEGESLTGLGTVYFDMGDLARSLEHHQAALQIEEELGDELGSGSRTRSTTSGTSTVSGVTPPARWSTTPARSR